MFIISSIKFPHFISSALDICLKFALTFESKLYREKVVQECKEIAPYYSEVSDLHIDIYSRDEELEWFLYVVSIGRGGREREGEWRE
jgi:hypothetical protein